MSRSAWRASEPPRIPVCPGPCYGPISFQDAAKNRPAGGTTMKKIDLANEPQGTERPLPSEGTGVWGCDAMAEIDPRPRHSVCRAQSGLVLSRPPRQPRQQARQRAPADAAVPARGGGGGGGAWLGQGHRETDAGDRPCQCRADARHHGGLQRVVRPRPADPAGRQRPRRRGAAPAMDRLDPHHARQRRAAPELHQMGRPAGLDPGGL